MFCKTCPHLVKHGQMAADRKTLEFKVMCGLAMKQNQKQECIKHPFPSVFDYMECEMYLSTFKTAARRNDVIPTQDFQFSDVMNGTSITDMELL